MAKSKKVLTTGEVARICNVAPRTVSKWFDSGQLKGYRIPGSKDRRIPVNELERFMKMHNMPCENLQKDKLRVLIVDEAEGIGSELSSQIKSHTDYEVEMTHTNFDTGLAAHKFSPHVIIVNLLARQIDARQICRSIISQDELQTIKLIAIVNNLGESEARALLQQGFDDYISNPKDMTEVIRKIEHATAIVY
jgi:excisionase family DNA binding protein